MVLNTNEREYFMRGIATYMVGHLLPNGMDWAEITRVVIDLLRNIPESVTKDVTAISSENYRPLRDRVADSEVTVQQILTDVRACGLLVDDPVAPGRFRFGHRSFMEFLAAKTVFENMQGQAVAESIFTATGKRAYEKRLRVPQIRDFVSELLLGTSRLAIGLGLDKVKATADQLLKVIFPKRRDRIAALWQIWSSGVFRWYRSVTVTPNFLLLLTFAVPSIGLFLLWRRIAVLQPSWFPLPDWSPFVFPVVWNLLLLSVVIPGLREHSGKVTLWMFACQKAGIDLGCVLQIAHLPRFIRRYLETNSAWLQAFVSTYDQSYLATGVEKDGESFGKERLYLEVDIRSQAEKLELAVKEIIWDPREKGTAWAYFLEGHPKPIRFETGEIEYYFRETAEQCRIRIRASLQAGPLSSA